MTSNTNTKRIQRIKKEISWKKRFYIRVRTHSGILGPLPTSQEHTKVHKVAVTMAVAFNLIAKRFTNKRNCLMLRHAPLAFDTV